MHDAKEPARVHGAYLRVSEYTRAGSDKVRRDYQPFIISGLRL